MHRGKETRAAVRLWESVAQLATRALNQPPRWDLQCGSDAAAAVARVADTVAALGIAADSAAVSASSLAVLLA